MNYETTANDELDRAVAEKVMWQLNMKGNISELS
jgi:hypothetical protein